MWKSPDAIMNSAKMWAVTGNYGSGKTELSLNLALESVRKEPTALVDLDIVNPYFRSAERESLLTDGGVRVLKPTFAMSTVDIPALPAEILSIFERGERVWLDVGGDDTGATALGRYKPQLDKAGAQMLFVVNARRPLTRDVDSIMDLLERVCARARMPVSALCNNTNLGAQSTIEDVLLGAEIVREVARRAGVAHAFHGVAAHLLGELPEEMRPFAFAVTPYMRPEWF